MNLKIKNLSSFDWSLDRKRWVERGGAIRGSTNFQGFTLAAHALTRSILDYE